MGSLAALLDRVLRSEPAAWHELWRRVEPLAWSVSGKWQAAGPLCKNPDERRNIVLAVMERLRQGDFRRLRAFAGSPGKDSDAAFAAWVTTLASRVAIDRLRAHPEHVDPRGRRGVERWAKLVALDDAPEPAEERDLLGRATALGLLERARRELSVEQLTALHLWLDGVGHAAIAERLRLDDERDARKVVRAALKRLRDRYRDAPRGQEAEDTP
jgi:DNA-directed RNA polymerase specialized sigma24 family protein